MTATANAAAVKAALTITARIAGRGVAAYVAGGTALTITRHNPDGTTATVTVPLDGATDGGGVVTDDVLHRIGKARGPVKVTDAEDGGLRFAADGVHLGATRPNTDGSDLQVRAWPHNALTSTYAVKVEADYGHHGPEVARAAVEALQGVAEAAARGSDARAVLTAVALHADGTAAATDTYRLHVADLQVEAGPDTPQCPEALVPAYVLQAIPSGKVQGFRLGAIPHGIADGTRSGWGMVVRLHYGGKANPVQVVIDANGPTVEGPYPGWRALVPDLQADAAWQAPIGTYVLPDGMAEAVKAVQAKGPMAVRWSDGADVVTLQACRMDYRNAVELAEDSATAALGTATTGAADLVLQGAYLAPAARFVGAGATVAVRDPWKAVALTGTGRTALVMPMRGPWS
jgi:hypothetical protein